jgi:hypothetical protein
MKICGGVEVKLHYFDLDTIWIWDDNIKIDINHLNARGSIYTICFNILKLCILTKECICTFRAVLTINSNFSLKSINRLMILEET